MGYIKCRKSVLSLLAVALTAVGLSAPAHAVIFKLPVASTATLSFDAAGPGLDGVPGVDYHFELNPPTLKFGYNEHSGLYYESMVIFGRQMLQGLPPGYGPMGLQLTLLTFPSYGQDYYFIQHMQEPMHRIAGPAEFSLPRAWDSEILPPNSVLYPMGLYHHTDPPSRQSGFDAWILGSWGVDGGPAEYAGLTNQLGLEGPYILVDVVPEPSACVGVASGCGVLIGLGGAKRRRCSAGLQARASTVFPCVGVRDKNLL